MNFDESLFVGQLFENIVLNYVHTKYPKAYRFEGYKKEYDIIVPETNTTIEVKSDFKSNYTGNFLIEVYMFSKPSGLITTEADWWVIIDGSSMSWIKPEEIKDIILVNGIEQRDFVGKGDTESKKAYLVPKNLIKDKSKVIKINKGVK